MIHIQREIKWLNCEIGLIAEKEIDRFFLLPFLALYIDNVFWQYMFNIGWGRWSISFGVSINKKEEL